MLSESDLIEKFDQGNFENNISASTVGHVTWRVPWLNRWAMRQINRRLTN